MDRFNNTTQTPPDVADVQKLKLGGYMLIAANAVTTGFVVVGILLWGPDGFSNPPYFAMLPFGVVGCLWLRRTGAASKVTIPLAIAFGLVSLAVFLRYGF
jgi:hypothetical protein